jgi:Holliday junction resolvasome RuvABC ATP-dependent DNA helicase subunit
VTAAASNDTIIKIAASAGAGFVALVICIVWARTRLTRRMQHYRASKLQPIMPKDGQTPDPNAESRDLGSQRTVSRVVRRIATRIQRVVLRRLVR